MSMSPLPQTWIHGRLHRPSLHGPPLAAFPSPAARRWVGRPYLSQRPGLQSPGMKVEMGRASPMSEVCEGRVPHLTRKLGTEVTLGRAVARPASNRPSFSRRDGKQNLDLPCLSLPWDGEAQLHFIMRGPLALRARPPARLHRQAPLLHGEMLGLRSVLGRGGREAGWGGGNRDPWIIAAHSSLHILGYPLCRHYILVCIYYTILYYIYIPRTGDYLVGHHRGCLARRSGRL